MRRRKRKGADKKLLSHKKYVINGNLDFSVKKDLKDDLGYNNTTTYEKIITEKDKINNNLKYRFPIKSEKNNNIMRLRGHWKDYFKNSNPIHIEVGTGRGKFITTLAKMNPKINYIALETKEEVLLKAVEKCTDEKIDNIAFLWGNVENLDLYFDDSEISRIYINFCDPWPKKRNAKRRLTSSVFLGLYKNKLDKNGEIHFKTDNKNLFEFSLNEFCLSEWKLKNISLDLSNSQYEDNITTEYEEKFINLGLPIYRLEAKKLELI